MKEEKLSPFRNAGNNENVLPSIRSEAPDETVSMHDRTKLTADIDPSLEIDDEKLPLKSEFESTCPPGGKDIPVLYTTSLRGIRKTFEDCNTVRFLLESFRISYSERDVSMHLEYRHELWGILGGRVIPPRLFIRGRYVGGAEEVVGLHERGDFRDLLQGIPSSPCGSPRCDGCSGMRFVLCFSCNGGRKVVEGGDGGVFIRCPDCNENGLIKCTVCS